MLILSILEALGTRSLLIRLAVAHWRCEISSIDLEVSSIQRNCPPQGPPGSKMSLPRVRNLLFELPFLDLGPSFFRPRILIDFWSRFVTPELRFWTLLRSKNSLCSPRGPTGGKNSTFKSEWKNKLFISLFDLTVLPKLYKFHQNSI